LKIYNFKICLKNPIKNDIIVFDETNSHLITDLVLNGLKPYVYKVRSGIIFISPIIILYFIKSLINFNWQILRTSKKKLRAIIIELLYHYHFVCFQFISPKVVITFIDNSGIFHWLCKNYKDAEFFAIQNGSRSDWELNVVDINSYYLTNYFCFGNYDIDRFNNSKIEVKNYFPIGSLIGGYVTHNNIYNNQVTYDICLVPAGYIDLENNIISDELHEYWKSYYKLVKYFDKYSQENNVRAAVLLRFDQNNNASISELELDYYKRTISNNIDIVNNNQRKYSNYVNALNSKVIIGSGSTILSELFGFGKKILHCDFSEKRLFTNYDPMIVFCEDDYDSFKLRLNNLRLEPYEEYLSRTKEYASYIMNYNIDLPPHKFIRNKIEKYL